MNDVSFERSFSFLLSDGNIPQYGISFIVKVMLNIKYMNAKKPINAQPERFTLNTTATTIAEVTAPINIHGLNFPHFVLVFSTIPPITGSLKASKILAQTIIMLTEAN